ncbi:phosphoenolpyruvate carboxylase [Bdellovibrio bacteriovorus]|uniref:phosphoenolpyruvate carboxylase n=1 Tax=Bdellovibrio bacteriovorus TaxID=959 RepID=UPI0021CEFFF4|nr:phosphoenolpyruvate carboxylase [Bdellovibrio bacteriovorus]UXR65184.1 phosphoenolpyruvate carboxylase [Bdellovibrio bacteriovorus]
MKKTMMTLILCSFFATPAMAAFYDVREAIEKLHAAKVDALITVTEDTKLSEDEMKAQDKAFAALEAAVTTAVKESGTEELQEEIIKATVVLLKKDPTQYAGEVVLPLYEKNKKSFLSNLKKLPASDAKLVEDAVKSAARQIKSGNG